MKNTALITFIVGTAFSINTLAFSASAVYLSAKPNESRLIETIKEKDDGTYRISMYSVKPNGEADYFKRTVNPDEISFATDEEINGYKVGRRALVLDGKSKEFVHCQVDNVFQNGFLSMFCDLYIEGVEHRRIYIGHSKNYVPEIAGPVNGINQGDTMILTRTIGQLEEGTRVRVRFLFKDGQILVDKKQGGFTTYVNKGQVENLKSVLVKASDLVPRGQAAEDDEN